MKTLIAYTDGGARPNPGYTGYGLHIVITNSDIKPKQIKSKYILTPTGYLDKKLFKKDKDTDIGLDKVIDVYGYNKDDKTNNAAELRAIHSLLQLLLSDVYENVLLDIEQIVLKLDSTYVLGFLNKIDNNADEFYDIPNVKLINSIRKLYKEVKDKYKNIILHKVTAHVGHIGNEKADMLATMGIYKNKLSDKYESRIVNIFEGSRYYNDYLEREPLLDSKYLFKFTNVEYNDRYYLFNYKDEEDIGRRLNDIIYSVVDINTKFKEIEDITRKFNESTTSVLPYIVKLDDLYNKNISNNLIHYGNDYLVFIDSKPYKITTVENTTLATEVYPPGLSYVAEDTFNSMSVLLDEYINNKLPNNYKIIDITDQIYYTDDKGKNKIIKDFKNDNYLIKINKKDIDKSLINNIIIHPGLDIPKRNTLKNIESHQPTVKLIIEDKNSYIKYYTILEVSKDNHVDRVLSMNKYANIIYKKNNTKE